MEELARRPLPTWASADRGPGLAPDEHVLVLTYEEKEVVMRPDALRPATAKATAWGRNKLTTRLSPGGGTAASEWPGWLASAALTPGPEDIITPPSKTRNSKKRCCGSQAGKWLTASVTDDISVVIGAAFDEAGRRAPGHHYRTWIVLATANAPDRGDHRRGRLSLRHRRRDLRFRACPGILSEAS